MMEREDEIILIPTTELNKYNLTNKKRTTK